MASILTVDEIPPHVKNTDHPLHLCNGVCRCVGGHIRFILEINELAICPYRSITFVQPIADNLNIFCIVQIKRFVFYRLFDNLKISVAFIGLLLVIVR